MSLKQQQDDSPFSDGDTSLFEKHVVSDWTICDNCYTRTHDIAHVYDQEKLKRSLRGVLTDEVDRHEHSAGTAYLKDYEPTQSRATFCRDCGDVNAGERDPQRNKWELLKLGRSVANRLEEDDSVRVDRSQFLDTVLDKKRNDVANDRRILRESTEIHTEPVRNVAADVDIRGATSVEDANEVTVHFSAGHNRTFDGKRVTMNDDGDVTIRTDTCSITYDEATIAGVEVDE